MVGRWRAGEEGSFSCARSLRAYISPVVNAVSERQSRRSGPASVLVRVRILLCARTPFRPTLRALGRIFSRFSRASEFFLTDKKKKRGFRYDPAILFYSCARDDHPSSSFLSSSWWPHRERTLSKTNFSPSSFSTSRIIPIYSDDSSTRGLRMEEFPYSG